jgi:S-DNA-T family DNA segregation ATPase FtsK/SpoIIIE
MAMVRMIKAAIPAHTRPSRDLGLPSDTPISPRRDASRQTLPRIVIALDELADLLVTGGKPVAEALTRLTQRGREAGFHTIAATQRPSAALVGGLMKANFPVRLVGSVVSPEDAKVASGVAGTEAERLLGRGDFLLVAKGQVIRFQAAYVAGTELQAIANRVRVGGRRRRCWQLAEVGNARQLMGGTTAL